MPIYRHDCYGIYRKHFKPPSSSLTFQGQIIVYWQFWFSFTETQSGTVFLGFDAASLGKWFPAFPWNVSYSSLRWTMQKHNSLGKEVTWYLKDKKPLTQGYGAIFQISCYLPPCNICTVPQQVHVSVCTNSMETPKAPVSCGLLSCFITVPQKFCINNLPCDMCWSFSQMFLLISCI